MDPQLVNYNGQLINLNGGVLSNKFPIRDGLVFYLDPAVDKCYPDTGTTATDLSPSGITTNLQNGVTFNSDNKGYFDFDGVDDYLNTTGDAVDLTHTDKYTLILWFRLDDYNSSGKIMVEHSINFNGNPGAWIINHSEYGVDGSMQHSVKGGSGWNISWTDDPYDDNVWHLYSVTYDASLSALDCRTHYIDGEVVAHTQHTTHQKNLNDFGVKKDLYFNSRAGSNFFSNHDLGLFQIYDRVLSQDEIRAIYNHHKQRFEHIITDGLVLNLDAQSKFSYPGTGTTWSDISPSGNDATLENGPTYQSDPAAIVFDGIDDYVEGTSSIQVQPSSITIESWIKPTGNGSHTDSFGNTIFTAMGGAYLLESGAIFAYSYSAQRITLSTDVNTYNHAVDVDLNDGIHHVAATYDPDRGSSKIYIDGQLVGTNSNTDPINYGSASNNSYQVGRWGYGSYGRHFEGNIYEVQVYDRALTDDEIAYNFEARRGRYGI